MANAKTICTVCNYIYDEAQGESRQEIKSSVQFEKLPEEWKCPECGAAKEMFQPCSCVSLPTYEKTCVVHSSDAISKFTTVGKLVAEKPSRACVFEQLAIDYCCGGKLSLEQACQKKGLNIDDVLKKLAESDKKGSSSDQTDWNKVQLKELIDHIVSAYHIPLRQELNRTEQLALKVARVHGDNHPEMIEVLNIFMQFKAKLELHMQKEEMVLFPGIKAIESTGTPQIFGCGGGIDHPIEVMTAEHDDAGDDMAAMRRIANNYVPPADACETFKVLLYSLAQIESEMHQHVHKENNILFPRALSLVKPLSLTS